MSDPPSGLPERPRLAARLNLLRLDDGRFLLQSLTESILLSPEQRVFADLAPLLTGGNDLASLLAALPQYPRREIVGALEQLRDRGLLDDPTAAEGSPLEPERRQRHAAQLTFFSHLAGSAIERQSGGQGTAAHAFQERLAAARVLLLGLGRIGSNLLRSLALMGVGEVLVADPAAVAPADLAGGACYAPESAGTPRVEAARRLVETLDPRVRLSALPDLGGVDGALAGCSLLVVAADDYNPSQYERLNRACLRARVPWTSYRWVGFEINMGPTVLPGETPCFTCFRHRLRANAPSDEAFQALQQYLSRSPWRAGHLDFVVGTGLAAYEILNLLSGFDTAKTVAHLFTFNLLTFESRLDPILKLPGCPDCGRPSQNRPASTLWEKVPRSS